MTDIDPDTITKVATPARRVLRTLIQVLAALLAGIPTALNLLPDDWSQSEQVTAAVGIMGAFVMLATIAMNTWDANGGTDTPALGVKVAPPTHPVEG